MRTMFCNVVWAGSFLVFVLPTIAASQEIPEYGPAKGTLVIAGGGDLQGTGIVETFIERAGGPNAKIVIVPTAAGNRTADGNIKSYKEEDVVGRWKKRFGLTHVRMLHTHDPQIANTEAFVQPLREATGVWFDGGRQWNLVDSYMNTLTYREFHNVLERGGVIGGSSAGATIQGDYLVRGAIAGPQIMMTPEPNHERGFDFLRKTAIDQHINTRNRWDDLIPVIKKYPSLLGIGLSEGTAIIVAGDRFEVWGKWKVAVHDNTRLYQPWEKPYYVLAAGDVYNMKTRKVEKYGNGAQSRPRLMSQAEFRPKKEPALLLTGTPVSAAPAMFTLEQVMSAPFPSDLTAAPKGGAVAWIFDDRGARNLWVAEPPAYQARRLTNYTEDDGVDLNTPEWTPDGRSLLYVRGGDEENGGEYPNPRSRNKRPEQALWIISLEKSPPRRLAEGHSPKVSPAGDQVAYIFKDQVWTVGLQGESKPRQLFEARGRCAELTWSPEGSRLAFVSRRTGHSFIGIYDMKAGSLRYLDPSVDQDSNPVWSPDGKEVVFLREPARRLPAFGPRREGEPWSIRMADPATGQGRALWTAAKGKGSVFHAVRAERQLFWAAGDRIVFPWERDGWTKLYAIARTGGSPTLLTPGAFEVEYVVLSGDRTHLIYNSNQDDIDRRHLWSVAVSGGPPTALTSGKGIEWLPAPTHDGKAMAFLRSDARRPPRPAIQVEATAVRDLAAETIPSDFPEAKLLEPQPVLFSAADGMMLHGQLFLPPDTKPGLRRPAVIFFHGGSRRQMLLGWHYMYYYRNAYAFNQYLASRGFVVLSVNYRSGIGYGLDFREALRYGASGASEYNDVIGAGLWLRDRPDVDSKRIGLWGGSYGGYLTGLGLARASDLFAAGVDIHGVYDWSSLIRNRLAAYDQQAQSEATRIAYESSPIAAVQRWRSPVLVVHGDDDRNVPFNESIHLVEDLRKQQVPLEQLIFPDEIHDFLVHRHWLRMQHASAAFLERWLKGKEGAR